MTVEAALRVEWVEDEGSFLALADPWDELAAHERLPFVRHAWFDAWWRSFADGRQLRICVARRGGRLAAAFPLARRGRRLEALANAHTPAFRPFAGDVDALRAVTVAVLEDGPDSLVVPYVAAADASLELLARGSRQHGRITLVQHQQRSPFADLGCGFADYAGQMDRKARKDIERRRRKLEAEHDAAIVPLAAPEDLDRELDRCFELEASGWKGERRTAIADSRATLAFYRELAHAFAADGRFRLSTISAGGVLVAFDYTLVDHGRLWVLKGGYDERFRSYGPGLVLTLAEIEAACALGLEGVELLGDEDPWKAKFATGVREYRQLRSYRRRPAPLAEWAYWSAVRPRLRSAYRRLNGRPANGGGSGQLPGASARGRPATSG